MQPQFQKTKRDMQRYLSTDNVPTPETRHNAKPSPPTIKPVPRWLRINYSTLLYLR